MKAQVTIASAARPEDGLGHLSRCSAIAVALRARGISPRCLGLGARAPISRDGIEWAPADRVGDERGVVIFDSYVHERPACPGLVAFHDEGDLPPGAALVISGHPTLAEADGVLAGPAYVCLRPRFWGLPRRGPAATPVKSVLVCTGGGDPLGVAVPLSSAVARALPDVDVRLVRGPFADWEPPVGLDVIDQPSDLLEALTAVDLAVTTAGQALYEALAVGVPSVALPIVSNQQAAAADLAARGAAVVTDDLHAAATEAVSLSADPQRRDRLSATAQQLVDGYGALRVAFRVEMLAVEVAS